MARAKTTSPLEEAADSPNIDRIIALAPSLITDDNLREFVAAKREQRTKWMVKQANRGKEE